jgi:hypothetical protein
MKILRTCQAGHDEGDLQANHPKLLAPRAKPLGHPPISPFSRQIIHNRTKIVVMWITFPLQERDRPQLLVPDYLVFINQSGGSPDLPAPAILLMSPPTLSCTGFRAAIALSLLFSPFLEAQNDPATPPPATISGSLYLDVWQLEKEFVVSPLALQEWLDLGLTADSLLTPEQREAIKPTISKFLAKKCPVTRMDEPIEFTLDRVHFIEPNAKEFALIDPKAVVSVNDLRISVVFAAPNTDLLHAIDLFWDLIPAQAPYITINVADAVETRFFNLSKFAPSLNVRGRYPLGAREPPKAPPIPDLSTIKIPWLSIALILCTIPVIIRLLKTGRPNLALIGIPLTLAGAAAAVKDHVSFEFTPAGRGHALDEAHASEIIDPLLRGVYHAFDYRDQSEQYDVLSTAVGGDALESIFLEIQRTLESRERDGSRVRVQDLVIESSSPTSSKSNGGFLAECAWEVSGRVGHWGHFHDRTNHYQATFEIEPLEETWKITGLTLHARERATAPTP